jgi:RNA polymerase sigma-70 factor, ECF subfamily
MNGMERFDSQPPDPPEHPTVSSLLLDGAKQMDPVAWSRLVSTFGPVVYRWCRSSGIRDSDAPDVVQEVFASVARGIGTFERQKEQGSFRSWLATITRNRVRDHFRRQSQRETAAGGPKRCGAWSSTPSRSIRPSRRRAPTGPSPAR